MNNRYHRTFPSSAKVSANERDYLAALEKQNEELNEILQALQPLLMHCSKAVYGEDNEKKPLQEMIIKYLELQK
jgi:type VI protein secretion system component VasF